MTQKDVVRATGSLGEYSKEAVTTARLLATSMREATLSPWLAAMASNGNGAGFAEPWAESIRKAHDLWLDACEAQARFVIDGTMTIFDRMQKR
jgi:hypothetical protein